MFPQHLNKIKLSTPYRHCPRMVPDTHSAIATVPKGAPVLPKATPLMLLPQYQWRHFECFWNHAKSGCCYATELTLSF